MILKHKEEYLIILTRITMKEMALDTQKKASSSQSAYNYLSQVYPFPCEKTLNRNFRSKVDEHSQILTKTIYANKRFDA